MPSFASNAGLAVYVRTTTRYDYSYIETAAVKIGDDILEVSSYGQYLINGISNAEMPAMISGYPVVYDRKSDNQHIFTIDLGEDRNVVIKVYKDLVYVNFDLLHGNDDEFTDTVGLMGSWKNGTRFARDGVSILSDPIEFGQEWQVRDTDAKLFMVDRAPQYPAKCQMPNPVERTSRRRLGEGISTEAAAAACAHIKDEQSHDMCVFDVIATNDLSVARGGAY